MKHFVIIVFVLFLLGACGSLFNREPNNYGGSWTDCSFDFINPENSYQVFHSENPSGFGVTILDSLDHTPLQNTFIQFGNNPVISSGKTNQNGSFRINSTELDTVFVTYLGFDRQYFYRDKPNIDSVVIFLSPCTLTTD